MYSCIERQVKWRRESQAARKVTISVLALDEGAPDFFFMKEASITIILRFLLHAVTCPSRALFLFPFFFPLHYRNPSKCHDNQSKSQRKRQSLWSAGVEEEKEKRQKGEEGEATPFPSKKKKKQRRKRSLRNVNILLFPPGSGEKKEVDAPLEYGKTKEKRKPTAAPQKTKIVKKKEER